MRTMMNDVRESTIANEIRLRLFELAEPDYKIFASRLIPGCTNMIGVRLPNIKKLARRLAKGEWREYFAQCRHEYFEETMLCALTIGCLREDAKTVIGEIRRFVPKINNWSLCDSFCCSLKIARREPEKFWALASEYLKSKEIYEVRFGVVMLINHFIDEEHIDEILIMLDGVKNEDYYVKMSLAWALSMCFVQFPEKTLVYLRQNTLADDTFNLTLRKICESKQVSEEQRRLMKTMKRK